MPQDAPQGELSTPAHVKAHATGRWAEIIFRALSKRLADRWQFVSFRGPGKGESRGVVDVVAIRRDMSDPDDAVLKRGDLFDVILIQIKGGGARGPTADDVARLKRVKRRYRARAIVLFTWKKGCASTFEVLGRGAQWESTSSGEIFGRR
jgi:hypothetical protein